MRWLVVGSKTVRNFFCVLFCCIYFYALVHIVTTNGLQHKARLQKLYSYFTYTVVGGGVFITIIHIYAIQLRQADGHDGHTERKTKKRANVSKHFYCGGGRSTGIFKFMQTLTGLYRYKCRHSFPQHQHNWRLPATAFLSCFFFCF